MNAQLIVAHHLVFRAVYLGLQKIPRGGILIIPLPGI
jgi:hypothetical protein